MKEEVIKFEDILKEFTGYDEYNKLKDEKHHSGNRYDHSIRVAKIAYKIAIKLNLDYISVTRASLLHDFFLNEQLGEKKLFNQTKNHARIALENSMEHFVLNDIEKNAILAHMFPINMVLPKSFEAIILKVADIGAAIYEKTKYNIESIVKVLNTLISMLINVVYKTRELLTSKLADKRELMLQKEHVIKTQEELTSKFIYKIPFVDKDLKDKCLLKINLAVDDIIELVFDDSKINFDNLTMSHQEHNDEKNMALVKKIN